MEVPVARKSRVTVRMLRFGSPTSWPFWTRVSVIRPFSSTIAALRIRWPSRVTLPLASRVWAVLLASKEKLRPPICGNWPGVAPEAGRDRVLQDPLHLQRRDRGDGERVVEAERVGDVELRDVARLLAGGGVGPPGKLGGAAARGRERADRVADAAAVLDRDRDRGIVLLGVPEVGVGGEIAEVGLLGADLAAAPFEVDVGAAEDVAVLLADDVGDAGGLLDAVVVDVETLDHFPDEVALGAGAKAASFEPQSCATDASSTATAPEFCGVIESRMTLPCRRR